jgi:hypothetical protein
MVPAGHQVSVYSTRSLPSIGSSTGGVWLVQVGGSSDETEAELDTILAGVRELLRGPRPRIALSNVLGPISLLMAPANAEVILHHGLLVWTVDAASLAGAPQAPALVQRWLRYIYTIGTLGEPLSQLVFLHEVASPGAHAIAALVRGLGFTVRVPEAPDATVLVEVHRPEGIIVSAIVGARHEPADPADASALHVNQAKDRAEEDGDTERQQRLESEERDALKEKLTPVGGAPQLSPVDRAPRLRRLLLAIADDGDAARAALYEELLRREVPLLVIVDPKTNGASLNSWPGGVVALPVYPDQATLLASTRDRGMKSDTVAAAVMPPPKLFDWAAGSGWALAMNVFRAPDQPVYVILPADVVKALAGGRMPAQLPVTDNPGTPKTPCRATVRSLASMEHTGEVLTEDGVHVRFGLSACKGFQPQVGMKVWLIALGPYPLGGYKATVINTTGKIEDTALADAKEANRRKAEQERREHALLRQYGLEPNGRSHWPRLVELPPARRRALAADLVQLKRESHLFDELFEELVTVEPELFHPSLAVLDWRTEPESLAWTRAPYGDVTFAVALLANTNAVALRNDVPVGTIGPGYELARRARAPANDLAAAALTLARSGCPEAISALAQWIKESQISSDHVNDLLTPTGWQVHEGALRQQWGHRRAFHAKAVADGPGGLFVASKIACPTCATPLLRLFEGAPEAVVPFPLFTCADCAWRTRSPYCVKLGPHDEPVPIMLAEPSGDRAALEREALPVPLTVVFEPAPRAVPHGNDVIQHMARVGGEPSWIAIRGPLTAGPHCPTCSVPAEFLAQFADPRQDGDMFYVFGCTSCRVAMTLFERY